MRERGGEGRGRGNKHHSSLLGALSGQYHIKFSKQLKRAERYLVGGHI